MATGVQSPRGSRTPQKKRDHPLVEPRLVAAVGIAAMGGGLGIGLMLARILIAWGFVISLASAISVLWIYASHFREAYITLTSRKRYAGASVKELISAIIIVCVLSSTSVAVFIVMKNESGPNLARLQFSGVSPIQYPRVSGQNFNAEFRNTGNVATIKAITNVSGVITNGNLSLDQENKYMTKLRDQIMSIDINKLNNAQLQPGQGSIITIPDLIVTEDEFNDIRAGTKALYVFAISTYEDENINGNGYWDMEYCGYFTVTFNYWHNCHVASQIIRVTHSR